MLYQGEQMNKKCDNCHKDAVLIYNDKHYCVKCWTYNHKKKGEENNNKI